MHKDQKDIYEMVTHIPLCTHPEPKHIFVSKKDKILEKELNKHLDIESIEYDIKQIGSKIDVFIDSENSIDIDIILPLLNKNAIVIKNVVSYWDNMDLLKKQISEVSKEFSIAMVYKVETDSLKGAIKTYLFLSKKYHPTANIILQKSDLLNEVDYYSSEIHISSFTHPRRVFKELTGIEKR